jgi:hypothetical protein
MFAGSRARWPIGYVMFVLSLFVALEFEASLGVAAAFIGLLLFLTTIVLVTRPAKLTIGADGVTARWLGGYRFVPYSAMGGVEVIDPNTPSRRRNPVQVKIDSAIALPIVMPALLSGDRKRADVIAERIRAGRRAARRSTDTIVPELERRGRSIEAWIDHLQSVGTGANADPRTPVTPPDALWAVLRNPNQEPSVRTAAAVALATDPQQRAHIREIAGSTASAELRNALELVADPQRGDELARALESIAARADHAVVAAADFEDESDDDAEMVVDGRRT